MLCRDIQYKAEMFSIIFLRELRRYFQCYGGFLCQWCYLILQSLDMTSGFIDINRLPLSPVPL